MRKQLPKINKQDNEELEEMKITEKDSIHVDLGVSVRDKLINRRKNLKERLSKTNGYEEKIALGGKIRGYAEAIHDLTNLIKQSR